MMREPRPAPAPRKIPTPTFSTRMFKPLRRLDGGGKQATVAHLRALLLALRRHLLPKLLGLTLLLPAGGRGGAGPSGAKRACMAGQAAARA